VTRFEISRQTQPTQEREDIQVQKLLPVIQDPHTIPNNNVCFIIDYAVENIITVTLRFAFTALFDGWNVPR
jgi:hypothetical protein